MPTSNEYVQWLDANQHLKDTPRYNGVLQEYRSQYAIEKQQYDAYQAQQAQQAQLAAAPKPEPLTGVFDLLGSGAKRTLAAGRISGDVLFNGEHEQENAQAITGALLEGQRAIPKELQEVRDAFTDEAEMFEEGRYVAGGLSALLEFGKQAITNPWGMAYSTAEQAANMAPGIVGAYTVGKATALAAGTTTAATGVGAPIAPYIAGLAGLGGSVVGGFAGQAPVEAGSEFIGKVGEELESRGLEVNEANVTALLRDKKWVTQAASDARVKGVTTALVDAAFTVGAGKLARGPMEKAMKKASDELGAGANIEQIVGRAEQIAGDRKLRTKIADAAKATGLDVVGGGASEAAGQLAAYGQVDANDVLQEMLGELGGAMIEIPTVAAGLAKRRPKGEEPDPLAPAPPAGGTLTPAGGTPNTPTTGGTPNTPTTGGTPNAPTTGGTPNAPTTGGTPNQPAQETPEEKKIREKKERVEQAMGVITQHTQSTGSKVENQENEWSMVLQQQMGLSAKEASNLLNEMGNKQNKLITGKKGDTNTRSIVDETEEKRLAEERKKQQSQKAGAILSQATGQTTPSVVTPPVVTTPAAAPAAAPVTATVLTKEAEDVLAMDPSDAELQFAPIDSFNQLVEIAKANGVSVDDKDMAIDVIEKLRSKKTGSATPAVTAPAAAPAQSSVLPAGTLQKRRNELLERLRAESAGSTTPAAAPAQQAAQVVADPVSESYGKAVTYIDNLRLDSDAALGARIKQETLMNELGVDKATATAIRKRLIADGQINNYGQLLARKKPSAAPIVDTAVDAAKEAAKEGLEEGLEGGAAIDEGDNIPFEEKSTPEVVFSRDAQNLTPGREFVAQIPSGNKEDDRPVASANMRVISEDDDIALDNSELVGSVLIPNIAAKEPGKGAGSKLLTSITDFADKQQVPLVVVPVRPELKNWYARNGFEDRGDFMVRSPVTQSGEQVGQGQTATETTETKGGASGAESVAGGTGAGVPVPVSRKRAKNKGAKGSESAALGNTKSGSTRPDEREDDDEPPVDRAQRRARQATKKETSAVGTITQQAAPVAAPAAPAVAKPKKEKKAPSVKQNTVEERVATLDTDVSEGRLIGKAQRAKLQEIKDDIAKLPAPDSPEHKEAVSSVRKKLSVLESKVAEPASSSGRASYARARQLVTRLRDRLLDRTVSATKKEKQEVDAYNKKVDDVYNFIKKNGTYDAEAIQREHGIDVVDSNEILRQLRESRLVNFDMKDARLLGEGRVDSIGSVTLAVNEDSESKINKVRDSLPANMKQVMLDVIEFISENGNFDVDKISEDYGVNADDSNYALNELRKEGLLNIDESTIVNKKSKVNKKERFVSTVRNVEAIGGDSAELLHATTLEQRLDDLEERLDSLNPNELDAVFGPIIEKKGSKQAQQIELMERLTTIEGMVEGSIASKPKEAISRALDRDTAKDAYNEELQRAYDERNRGVRLSVAASASETNVPFREKLKELAIAGDLRGLLTLISNNARNIGSDVDELSQWTWRTNFDPANVKDAKVEELKSIVADESLSKGKRDAAQREVNRLLSGKSHNEVKFERKIEALEKLVNSIGDANDESRYGEAKEALKKIEALKTKLDAAQKARIERGQMEADRINPLSLARIEDPLSLGRDKILSIIARQLGGSVTSPVDLSSVTVVVEGSLRAVEFFEAMRKAGKVAAYDPSSNTMYLSEDAFNAPVYIMHEVAHAVTAVSISEYGIRMAAGNGKTPVEQASERMNAAKKALDKVTKETGYNPESSEEVPAQVEAAQYEMDTAENLMTRMAAVARIEEIYKEAKKQLGTIQRGDVYFQDILEFVAYAFTDIRLQMALSKIRTPKSKLSQLASKTFDMLSELSQTVLELIGLVPKQRALKAATKNVFALEKEVAKMRVEISRAEKNLSQLSREAKKAAQYEYESTQTAIDELNKQIEKIEKDIGQYSGASPFKQGLQNMLIDAERALVRNENKLLVFRPEEFIRTYKLDKEAEYTNNIAKAKARIEELTASYPKVLRNFNLAEKQAVENTENQVYELEQGGALLDFLEAFEAIMTAPGATTNLPVMYATKNKSKNPQQKKKPGYKDATNVSELDSVARDSLQRKLKRETSKFLPIGKYYFGGLQGYRNLVRDYQNGKRWWSDFQNDLDLSGKLELFGEKFNNVYDKLTTSAAKAKNAYTKMFAGNNDNVDRGMVNLNNFLKKKMGSVADPETGLMRDWELSDTVAWLDLRLKAIHVDERREVKYLLNVPMSDVKNIPIKMPDGTTEMMSAAGYRDVLYRELLKDEDMTEGSGNNQAKLIRQMMQNLVDGGGKFGIPAIGVNSKTGFSAYLDPEGRATNDRDYPNGKVPKARSLDKKDDRYNVYAGLDGYINDPNDPNNGKSKAALLVNDYNSFVSDPKIGQTLTDLVANLREMQDKTKQLNKETKYQSTPVSNLIDFYGWDFYVPMKGVDGKSTEVSPGDSRFDIHGTRVAADVTDNPQAAAMGRMSDSDNVISRIKDDAFKSSSRVGRDGITTAIGNIVEMLGESFGEVALKVDFMERHTGAANKALSELRGKDNVFFDYKQDGTVIAYKINNKEAAIALRRTYEPLTSFDTFLAKWTSRVSQLHTRFKLSFAPYDFMRNATFNSTVFAARYGVKKGAQMGMTIATRLGRNSWAKAGRVLLAYKNGDTSTIDKLAKKNPIYKDMHEFLQEGGESAYIQIFAQSGKLGSMLDDLDKSKFRMNAEKTGEFVTGAFDLYNNMFELANRSASYGVVRDEMVGKLTKDFKKKNSRDPNPAEQKEIYDAAKERAASYTKNLTNFELTGARANKMIARFAFFRPAATGAVSAMDAIMPVWVDAKTMYANMSPELKAVLDKDPEARKNYANNYKEIQKNARTTATVSFLAGMAVYMMAFGMGDDDDEGRNKVAVDDKAQWTRNARIPLNWILDTLPDDSKVKARFKDKVFNIPFGFGFGAVASAGAQFAMLANGHVGFKDFLFNNVIIAADSFMPLPISRINPWEHEQGPLIGGIAWAADSVTPSLFRPGLELVFNLNGLGRSIFNENVNKYGPAYQSTDKVTELYAESALAIQEATGLRIQPTELAFLAGSYFDGVSEVASWANSMGDLYYTDRPFDPKTDTLVLNRFIGAPSRVDPKNFFKVQRQANDAAEIINSYKNTNPEKYFKYIADNPNAYWLANIHNNVVNGELKDVREQINMVRANNSYTPLMKKQSLKQLYDRRDHIMYLTVDYYNRALDVEP